MASADLLNYESSTMFSSVIVFLHVKCRFILTAALAILPSKVPRPTYTSSTYVDTLIVISNYDKLTHISAILYTILFLVSVKLQKNFRPNQHHVLFTAQKYLFCFMDLSATSVCLYCDIGMTVNVL